MHLILKRTKEFTLPFIIRIESLSSKYFLHILLFLAHTWSGIFSLWRFFENRGMIWICLEGEGEGEGEGAEEGLEEVFEVPLWRRNPLEIVCCWTFFPVLSKVWTAAIQPLSFFSILKFPGEPPSKNILKCTWGILMKRCH